MPYCVTSLGPNSNSHYAQLQSRPMVKIPSQQICRISRKMRTTWNVTWKIPWIPSDSAGGGFSGNSLITVIFLQHLSLVLIYLSFFSNLTMRCGIILRWLITLTRWNVLVSLKCDKTYEWKTESMSTKKIFQHLFFTVFSFFLFIWKTKIWNSCWDRLGYSESFKWFIIWVKVPHFAIFSVLIAYLKTL